MSLSSTVVGETFGSANISYGAAVQLGNGPYTYTEVASLALLGITATIQTYNTATNAITFTLSTTGSTVYSGNVIGNTGGSFLVGVNNLSIVGISAVITDLYFSNAEQAVSLQVSSIPSEPTSTVYTPACYCHGTMVRTPDGLRAVEDLQMGDLVNCLNGGVTAVRWVGRRSYGGRFLRANPQLRPIRFKAGSLGEALPARDLLVSPRHSMLIGGVLIPAELLVNGTTVVVDTAAETVDYVHVELPQHDAIWAEDVLSETFVDDGSRGMFHNAHTFADMYPHEVADEAAFFAPRLENGPALDAVRRKLRTVETDLPLAA